jgi:excisionase family DNA binding protein
MMKCLGICEMNDELLSIGQTAKLLSCSKSHVRRLHAAGKLVGIDISLSGRACWRWRRSVVEAFLKSRD